MDVLLDQREAARALRLSTRTLEKLRTYGGGPAFAKLGKRVLYPPAELRAWVEARTVASTAAVRARVAVAS